MRPLSLPCSNSASLESAPRPPVRECMHPLAPLREVRDMDGHASVDSPEAKTTVAKAAMI